ncbi:hypothetical protein [Streptomyces sp. NPDC057686]|uniref:beta family protein n=1 Tax=Streptomyces sp. NPDC057686 TaxID=3346212 RepID=UPI00368E313B
MAFDRAAGRFPSARRARPELPVDVTYGDYGAHRAFAADTGAGGGPPWGVLRYTTDRTFILAKAPTTGEGHAEEVRETARRMIAEPDFRGAGFGEGDRWLHECATGRATPGVGNADRWIRAGHSRHLACAARRLTAWRTRTAPPPGLLARGRSRVRLLCDPADAGVSRRAGRTRAG